MNDPCKLLLLLGTLSVQLSNDDMKASKAQMRRDYYARWVGVAAPEFGPKIRDRLDGDPVRIGLFRGKKTLLFSFDSGDFVRGADEAIFPENLRYLNRVMNEQAGNDVAVVGFTYGVLYFFPNVEVSEEIRNLSQFPIVNANAIAARDAPEPYRLFARPGGIVIDRNGIIQAVFLESMTTDEISDAMAAPDWDKPPRPAPVDDPWLGTAPPKPQATAVKEWSIKTNRLVGLTSGDWDADGKDEVILLHADHSLTLVDQKGREERSIPLEASSRQFMSIELTPTKEGSQLVQCARGWPQHVPVFDDTGRFVRQYPEVDLGGIDAATWVDIDGDKISELLVGFNGAMGLHLVSSGGELLWSNNDVGNRWCVAGLDARLGRPGLALSTGSDGSIRIYDAGGRETGRVLGQGEPIIVFTAAEMRESGERQLLYFQKATVGTIDHAVATDLGGNLLWRYPIAAFRSSRWPVPIVAADVTGDGIKEWVFQASVDSVVAVNINGDLIAQFPISSNDGILIAATKATGENGERILVSDGKVLDAFKIK